MKELKRRNIEYNVRKIFKNVNKFLSHPCDPRRKKDFLELKNNGHIVRTCCLSVLNVKADYSECSLSEGNIPIVLEEARDFCEIYDYKFSEEILNRYLKNLKDRRQLSYAEISCIIPSIEYCCLIHLNKKIGRSSIAHILNSLRLLTEYDCSALSERISQTEDVLKKDSVYPFLDKSSKELYRKKLRAIAKKLGRSEREVAVDLLKASRKHGDEKSGQIGAHLLKERHNKFYFPVLISLAFITVLFNWLVLDNFLVVLFSVIPAVLGSKLFCDSLFSRFTKPQILPKIKINEENCPKTLVTVVSILSGKDDVDKLLHRVDVLSHRIRLKNVCIGLLLDLPATKKNFTAEEENILNEIKNKVSVRNEKENRFFCAVRKRILNEATFQYEPFGRKQGAIIDFCDLICGNTQNFLIYEGTFNEAKYIVTLDSDTEPTLDSVEALIGFMEHPNHTPVVRTNRDGISRVVSGYGASAPRVEANPETSYKTPFSSLISGNSGTELYKNPHFNLYQDLFSEGIFCGKGILSVSLYRDLIGARFRKDAVLSHDLPEGEFLRCANLSDIVFFDEIPNNVISDEKRSHRWIRGDFQNIRFLSPKEGASPLFSFKIVFNLLRAIEPVFLFLLFAITPFVGLKSFFVGAYWIAYPFLLRLGCLLKELFSGVKKAHPYRDCADALFDLALNFLLLPSRAFCGLDGGVRGCFRLITGKKILEWTTAAGAACGGKSIGDYVYGLRWQEIGFLLLFFPETIIIGVLWMIAPIIAHRVSMPYAADKCPVEDLKKELSLMWGYYADLINDSNHWLPPDNYQVDPLNVVAQRTSPTNIGLAFLSVMGAKDISLIPHEEMLFLMEQMLTTIESLPKWKGHLYNWYDTQTLKVLLPKFVSTVDSGNFAASLYTVEKGLQEIQEERVVKIRTRIKALLEKMDFRPLYDSRKNLFFIGYNEGEDSMTSSYYDLYASESRLTSYYTIMTHQIPAEHWNHLARPVNIEKGDLLIKGWSGTMFEYFMPNLFLPAYRRTLSGEMLKGVLNAQIRFVGKNIPWGISESGYYGFDSQLNYQYRAFGIPSAALRRDLPFPKVISSYSTFLAYPWFPSVAHENQKRLPRGKYGCYEAIDYRMGEDNPRIIQSYMAHHVGMSFLAGVNVLTLSAMQKRFMREEGEACVSLLTEGIPPYNKNFYHVKTREKEIWRPTEQRIDKPDPDHPKVKVLSNGKINELISDSGMGGINTGEICITAPIEDNQSPEGIFFFIQNKGRLFGTTYAPLYDEKCNYRMFFDGAGATCYGMFDDFESRVSLTHHTDYSVSVRELTIKNNQMTEGRFDYFFYLRPVLIPREEYSAHPEYKDLFLGAEYNSELGIISFVRRQNGKEYWISVKASEEVKFDVCRDSFGRFEDISSCRMTGCAQYPIFPALVLRGTLDIRGRGTATVRIYVSYGETKKESHEGIQKVFPISFELLGRRYDQAFDSMCRHSEIRAMDRMIFEHIAAKMLLPNSPNGKKKKLHNALSRDTLWKYGISGDYPILLVRIGSESVSRVSSLLKASFLFLRFGIHVDTVFLYKEEDSYNAPLRTALEEISAGMDENLKRKIFFLNVPSMEEYIFFQKCSSFFVNLERGWKIPNPQRSFRPIRRAGTSPVDGKAILPLGRGYFGKNNSFIIPKNQDVFRPWSLVLANPRIGTVINERGLGFTFGKNASENRITPRVSWNGYHTSGEKLYAVIRGKRYDILANATAEFYPWKAVYRLNLFDHKIITEVFIPIDLPAKIIRITLQPADGPLPEVVYEPRIVLSKDSFDTTNRELEQGNIFFSNPYRISFKKGTAVLFGFGVKAEGETLRFIPRENSLSADMILGYGAGPMSARMLTEILSDSKRIQKELLRARTHWDGAFLLESPSKELNCFCNGFLLQQVVCSRILGRTGPAQPGGAYGFRDQLQDSVNYGRFDCKFLRKQIRRCCAHQFEEGDVLHWWHPRPKNQNDGIRTRFSDDPFWLVYACCEYQRLTGDYDFLSREIFYLSAPPLEEGEKDRYFTPQRGEIKESVYLHALRAYQYGMKQGSHGLILFGSGDWNDGLNRVGNGGETVWGTMFALMCGEKFKVLAEHFNDEKTIKYLNVCCLELRQKIEEFCYHENRYLRGFLGDGSILGGESSVDLLPQAFAQFCGLDSTRVESGLTVALHRLWDPDLGILRLLDPPYTYAHDGSPGSIGEYPQGVRENGGQYTHAAIWFVKALFEAGQIEMASEILLALNPVTHNTTPFESARYGGEPYVIAADVYSLPDRKGFAGWTHYTGAAGWYLRIVTENLLGITREENNVTISPKLPRDWNTLKVEFRMEKDVFKVFVERGTEKGMYENEKRVNKIPLNGAEHTVSVII